jgi:hypothetical protein
VPMSPPDALAAWHDFFLMIGTASATLVGAMFVVVSIGTGFLTRENAAATHVFLTSTVLHLSTILLGCAFVMVPIARWEAFATILGIGSTVGLVYSAMIGFHVNRRPDIEFVDRVWYGAVPFLAYTLMVAGAPIVMTRWTLSLELLAVAFVLLLIASLRNAWDMILFIVTRARETT